MTLPHDTEYLQIARQLIEKKLGWPPSAEWRDSEFGDLGDKIFEASGVQLSTTTLKRVFGKVLYKSLPSSVTLNALASYLGYENWMDFKAKQPASEKLKKSIPGFRGQKRNSRVRRKTIITGITLFVVIAISGFILLSGTDSSAIPTRDVVFTSRPLAEGLPNSVVFKTDLKGIKSNDIYIQQSWDSTRTVRLKSGQTEATGIYYIPGYFRAKLIVNKKIIKEHDLFIPSQGWMATIDHPVIPDYIRKEELLMDGEMRLGNSIIEKIKTLEKPTTVSFHLVQPFNRLHSDNFSFQTSVLNVYGEGSAICKTLKLFILCSKGAFIIPFTIPGCASDINLKISEGYWEGKSNDLSVFGVNTSEKMDINVEVKNRQFSIFLNGKLLRSEKYKADAGDIVGLRYSFLGAGSVDKVQLKNGTGEIIYENDFKLRD